MLLTHRIHFVLFTSIDLIGFFATYQVQAAFAEQQLLKNEDAFDVQYLSLWKQQLRSRPRFIEQVQKKTPHGIELDRQRVGNVVIKKRKAEWDPEQFGANRMLLKQEPERETDDDVDDQRRQQRVQPHRNTYRYQQLAMEEELRREQAMSQSFLLLVAFCAVLFSLMLSILGFATFYYVSIIHRGGFSCWATAAGPRGHHLQELAETGGQSSKECTTVVTMGEDTLVVTNDSRTNVCPDKSLCKYRNKLAIFRFLLINGTL
uniref:Uncharacterized protein n=1 Tax=Globodera pallida TaxID=36090 RepID=A0A183CHR0_GLOPA